MNMATVIFDFDSTLITCESLDEILSLKIINPKELQNIKLTTMQGMSGEISFLDSLEKRLYAASLSRLDFESFGNRAIDFLTPGMTGLIQDLLKQSVEIWIVSGAIREAIGPLGKKLGISQDRILSVELQWSSEGRFLQLDTTMAFNRSKWEGAQKASLNWSSPKVAIGDGITDYALFEHGLVDHFLAFTQNVRREAILEKNVPEVKNVDELRTHLERILSE